MQLFARDIMARNFDTIHRDDSVEKAITKILNAKVRPTGHKTVSLMVVDDAHALVGTISMYYILYHLRPSYLNYGINGNDLNWQGEIDGFVREVKKKKVAQIMNDNVLYVQPDESVMAVLDRMIKNRIRRISVVDGGKLVGVIYMSDIFYHLFSE
ncbi:CBS domain-containing protein [Desulfobulbus sp.]|uniref:CBS domain-containing protein n=1 Tax=Desulfobulbus sp. TaxID=895 RepID=UPI00286F848A|nr:CBS domain-containing protein [Desulfobulbus sp.]